MATATTTTRTKQKYKFNKFSRMNEKARMFSNAPIEGNNILKTLLEVFSG